MRAYSPSMTIRRLMGLVLATALLFASALTGSAAASAATMNHDMPTMQMGHCGSSPSTGHDGKPAPKQCCIAMCAAAVAIAPAVPAELPALQQAVANFPIPAAPRGCLAEIATPPPRLA